MMESWTQCIEYIDSMVLGQRTFCLDDLVPKVRHLPLPWNTEEPLRSYLRKIARDCATRHGIELRFNHHGEAIYAVSREELMKLLREQERRLRSQGRRFATIALKVQKQTRRKAESPQMQFDFDNGTYATPEALHRSTEEIAATANVVPLKPLDDDALWPVMVQAFTHGNSARIPTFSQVLAEFVRRQLGIVVPEEAFREDLVPVAKLKPIYDDLVRTVTELVRLVPPESDEGASNAE